MIRIDGKLVNKANNYEIRIARSLWQEIRVTVEQWKRYHKGPPWWIGPSDEAKTYQELVAWAVRSQGQGEWTHGEPVELRVMLVGQAVDLDGIKAVCDGIQDSGRIKNDRQISRLLVCRGDGKPGVELEVESL